MTIPHCRLLLFILACCAQWSSVALAQSQVKSASQPVRTVKRQVLTSNSLPRIRLKFDHHFKYAGTQKFVLYERSQAEQFFFVDADNRGQFRRMYMVQFEGYLPQINATYNYPATETVALNGQTYIVNADSVPSLSAVLKQEPESDVARAVAFLTRKGLHVPESVRYQRFVRVVDETKRNEFIFVYVEDASAATSAAPQRPDKEFPARALKGVQILN
jgi:hypothetical protein